MVSAFTCAQKIITITAKKEVIFALRIAEARPRYVCVDRILTLSLESELCFYGFTVLSPKRSCDWLLLRVREKGSTTHSLWTDSRQARNHRACLTIRCACSERLSANDGLLWAGRRRSWQRSQTCIGPTLVELNVESEMWASVIWSESLEL